MMSRRVYIESLAVGNITQAEVSGMAEKLRALLSSQLGTCPVFPSQVADLGSRSGCDVWMLSMCENNVEWMVAILQKQDYRTVRLPSGPTTLFVEPGPNPTDANSAVLVAYQVWVGAAEGTCIRPK